MIVCVCNAVTESEIRACVEFGCCDFDEIRDALGVASNCGCCRESVVEVITTCQRQEAQTAD